MNDAVKVYAQRNNLGMVLRFNGDPIDPNKREDVLRAISAVLVVCQVKGFNSLAVPLMGAFEAGIPAEEAARAIHSQVRAYRGDRPSRVVFAPSTPDEVDVFEIAMDSMG